MHVAELWRFPVKSMAGEPLGRGDVRPDGVVGGRVADGIGAHGRIVTARTRPRVPGPRARPGVGPEPPGDGRPGGVNLWGAPRGTLGGGRCGGVHEWGGAGGAAAVWGGGGPIPASSAKRETAPLRMSSSVGPPASRSTRKLGFIADGRPSI